MSLKDRLNDRRKQFAEKKAGWNKPYKWKQGKNRIRILPAVVTAEDPKGENFFRMWGMNWVKDPSGENATPVGDRSLCYQEATDPVREAMMEAYSVAGDEYRKIIKAGFGRQEVLVNALIMKDTEVDPNTPTLVKFSETQFDKICNMLEEFIEEGIENPLALKGGFDITVDKSGTTMKDTEYNFIMAPKATDVADSVMEKLIDLDLYVKSCFEKTQVAINVLSTSVGRALSAPASTTASALGHHAGASHGNGMAAALTGPAAGLADEQADVIIDADVEEVDASLEGIDDDIPDFSSADDVVKELVAAESSDSADLDDILGDLDNL